MIYCTHSDKNYLAKGIAMCNSIIEHDPTAHIFYLCLDDETYDAISKIYGEGMPALFEVTPVALEFLEYNDAELVKLKNYGHTSNYGNAYSQFCWSLTPYFTWFLLKRADITSLLYCDADLLFYDNPAKIAEACNNKSLGIHTHGFSSYDPETNDVGEFNVGCVYFKNNETGKKVAETWKNWMLNPQNEYASKFGTCGDQKYLDLFIPLFGAENIAVFDRDTTPIIHHAAPWNFSNYEYKDDKMLKYAQEIQLLFTHFSHFNTDINGNWQSSNHGEWKPEENNNTITQIYVNYNQKVMKANKLLQND